MTPRLHVNCFTLRDSGGVDEQFKGSRLVASDCPAYFAALASKRPVVADHVLTHSATSGLAETYLKPLGISSMLDAPVWVGGKVVGVLCHRATGPSRDWSAEEVDFRFGARSDGFAGSGGIKSSAVGASPARERGTLQQGLSHQPGEYHHRASE